MSPLEQDRRVKNNPYINTMKMLLLFGPLGRLIAWFIFVQAGHHN
jgi:hypothetical protein